MAYLTHTPAVEPTRRAPLIDPAWILLTLTFVVLLSAALWSDHVVDRSLEDWHGNVRSHATDGPR